MLIRLNNVFYTLESYSFAKAKDLEKSIFKITTISNFKDENEEEKNRLRKILKDTFWECELQKRDDTDIIVYLTLRTKNDEIIEVPIQQFVSVEVI